MSGMVGGKERRNTRRCDQKREVRVLLVYKAGYPANSRSNGFVNTSADLIHIPDGIFRGTRKGCNV